MFRALLLLATLGFLAATGWRWIGGENGAEHVVRIASDMARQVLGEEDLPERLRGLVDAVKATTVAVGDEVGASETKERVEEARRAIDDATDDVRQLPREVRTLLASAIDGVLPALRAGATNAGPNIRPTLEAMIATLEGWARPAG